MDDGSPQGTLILLAELLATDLFRAWLGMSLPSVLWSMVTLPGSSRQYQSNDHMYDPA